MSNKTKKNIESTSKPGLYMLSSNLNHPRVLITRQFKAFTRRNYNRMRGRLLHLFR